MNFPNWYQVRFITRNEKNTTMITFTQRTNFKQKMKGILFWPFPILLKPDISLKCLLNLTPFSLLRDFSFQNTSEHFAIRFRQSYLIWEVCDVTAIELSSKE